MRASSCLPYSETDVTVQYTDFVCLGMTFSTAPQDLYLFFKPPPELVGPVFADFGPAFSAPGFATIIPTQASWGAGGVGGWVGRTPPGVLKKDLWPSTRIPPSPPPEMEKPSNR